MRAFIAIALLVIILMILASNTYAGVDLTPDTVQYTGLQPSPTPWVSPFFANSTAPQSQAQALNPAQVVQSAQQPGVPVTGGQAQVVQQQVATQPVPCPTPVAIPVTGGCPYGNTGYYYPGQVYYYYPAYTGIPVTGIPVTGACPNPYLVLPGDTLSRISLRCGTSLQALIVLNPYIYNPNLIYPGQALWLYPPTGTTGGVPVTGPVVAPTPAPAQSNPIIISPAISPIKGGSTVTVKVFNFPVNTPVNIGVGRIGQSYQVVNTGTTDASGNLQTTVLLPTSTNAQEQWTVVAATTSGNLVQAASQPFTITP